MIDLPPPVPTPTPEIEDDDTTMVTRREIDKNWYCLEWRNEHGQRCVLMVNKKAERLALGEETP